MCGIVGYIGTAPVDPDKFKLLMLYNESRGRDSSGIYIQQQDKLLEQSVIKKVGLISLKMLPDLHIPSSKLLIAHTRQATYGVINEKNSHPFVYNDTVGVHNGKVDNDTDLKNKYNYTWQEIDVDSQIFYKYLGNNKDYKVLEDYNGKAALLFTKNDNKLYAYHDKERPLFKGSYKYDNGTSGVYFSSLEESLKAIECSNIQELKIDQLYIFKPDGTAEVKKINRSSPYKHVYNYSNTNSHVSKHSASSSNAYSYNTVKNTYSIDELKYPEKANQSPWNRILKKGYKGETVYFKNNLQWVSVRYEDGTEMLHRTEFRWDHAKSNEPRTLMISMTKFNIEKTLSDGSKIIVNVCEYNDGGYEELFVRKVPTPVISVPSTTTFKTIGPNNPYSVRNCINVLETTHAAGIAKLSISDKIIHSFDYNDKQYLIERLTLSQPEELASGSPFKDTDDLISYQNEEDWNSQFLNRNDYDTEEDDYSPIDRSLDETDFSVIDDSNDNPEDLVKELGMIRSQIRNTLTFVESKGVFKVDDIFKLEEKLKAIHDNLTTVIKKPILS